jgi:hypothetical protein
MLLNTRGWSSRVFKWAITAVIDITRVLLE